MKLITKSFRLFKKKNKKHWPCSRNMSKPKTKKIPKKSQWTIVKPYSDALSKKLGLKKKI